MTVAAAQQRKQAVTPQSISVSEVMMQDVVAAAGIPVAAGSDRPIAPFRNPFRGRTRDPSTGQWTGPRLEALVLTETEGQRSVLHLAKDPAATHGWEVSPVFAGHQPVEIAVADFRDQLVCLFLEGGQMYRAVMGEGATWSEPEQLQVDAGHLTGLSLTYGPDGFPVMYASDSDSETGRMVQVIGNRVRTSIAPGVPLRGRRSAYSGSPDNPSEEWMVSAAPALGGRNAVVVSSHQLGTGDLRAYRRAVPTEKRVRQMLAGLSTARGAPWFLLLYEDGMLATLRAGLRDRPDEDFVRPLSDSWTSRDVRFRSAMVRSGREQWGGGMRSFRDIYAVDERDRLWIIRQDRQNPWASDMDPPQFCPPVPVDQGVGGVAVTGEPVEEASVFSYGSADHLLRLELQDPRTRMWREVDVLPPAGATLTEVVSHRVEAVVRGVDGTPVPHQAVTLATSGAASECEIWQDPQRSQASVDRPADGAGGAAGPGPRMFTVTAEGVRLCTDAAGRVVFSVRADALATPELTLTAGEVSTRVRPGESVLRYLSGNGTLRETHPDGPLPQFTEDGAALSPLNPEVDVDTRRAAARWIRTAAHSGLNSAPGAAEFAPGLETDGTADLAFGPWDAFTHWAGDVWRGIRNSVVAVEGWVIEGGALVVKGVTWLGEEFVKGGRLLIAGMQQAAHALAALFGKVVDDVRKAIDWLKAVFDFGAIWRTKQAFEQGLIRFLPLVAQQLDGVQQKVDPWLEQSKEQLNDLLDKAQQGYGRYRLGSATQAGTPGDALRQHTAHPQVGWLMDKLHANPPRTVPFDASDQLSTEWQQFRNNLSNLEHDGRQIVDALDQLGRDVIRGGRPAQQNVGDVLKLLRGGADALLDGGRTILDGLAGLAKAGLAGINDLLTATLPVPAPLRAVWSWIVRGAGGDPESERLTLASLLSLLAAMPVTVVHKLVKDGAEPFPDGRLPLLDAPSAVVGAQAGEKECLFVAGILQALSYMPALTSDALGPAAPTWLTVVGIVWSGLILLLANIAFVSALLKGAVGSIRGAISAIVVAELIQLVVGVVLYSFTAIAAAFAALKRFAPLALTGLGVLGLMYYVYKVAENKFPNVGTVIGGALTSLTTLTAFLNFEAIRDSEYALPAKVTVDAIGNISGGVLIAVNAGPLTDAQA
ncbi:MULTISPECIES: hypothetical protein [Streptomyces]|uniref:Uncharacterized protein n=1 Tax=Streptomyces siderophoricus TaxID=2802281 RepID=A0ABS1N1X7_9ACTN|nr:hypothetical protein [Streptomyces sp. 9-7]MBL1093944.1 hypothetical protein [Streptomyces sp. 9-7]